MSIPGLLWVTQRIVISSFRQFTTAVPREGAPLLAGTVDSMVCI